MRWPSVSGAGFSPSFALPGALVSRLWTWSSPRRRQSLERPAAWASDLALGRFPHPVDLPQQGDAKGLRKTEATTAALPAGGSAGEPAGGSAKNANKLKHETTPLSRD